MRQEEKNFRAVSSGSLQYVTGQSFSAYVTRDKLTKGIITIESLYLIDQMEFIHEHTLL